MQTYLFAILFISNCCCDK